LHAAGIAGGRMAAQRMDLVAARQKALRRAQAQVTAADQKYAFAHVVAPGSRKKRRPAGRLPGGRGAP